MLFDWLVPPCINFVTKYCKHFVKCHAMHLTASLLTLYTSMLEEVR